MNFDTTNNAMMLSNRRKQTNPKQLHPIKQDMTVVDESELGSYFQLTPRSSLEVTSPSQTAAPRSASDGNIIAYKELIAMHQKRNSWPFATVFPGFNPPPADPDPAGPPPLAKISSSTITSTTVDQPINLSSTSADFSQKRRSTNTAISTPPSIETAAGDNNNSEVLDLSAKPPFLVRVSGASPGLKDANSASTTPFVPPKAHSRQKVGATKFCRLCSREIELTLLEGGQSGLCLGCQQRGPAEVAASSLPVFPGNINPLAGLVPPLVPALTSLPFDLASALAAHTLLPGVFNATAAQPPSFPSAENNLEIERIKSESAEQCQSPVSSCGSNVSNNRGEIKEADSPSSSFTCQKCNINFRSAKSLEAHQVDYCQQSGHVAGARKGAKRRSVDATNPTGQDLVCQLCGYHGHSERGIRVHFNAMHSIGSEIQLEQYLTTMIVRAEPSTTMPDPLKPENTPPPKKRRPNGTNTSAETAAAFNLLDLAGVALEPPKKPRNNSSSRASFSGRGSNSSTTLGQNNASSTGNGSTVGSLRRQPPFECRLCSKTFPDTAKLRLHMRSHEKDESIMYSCKRCNNFTTSVKSDLVRHVKIEHEGVNMRLSTWTVPRQPSHAAGSRDEATGGKSSSSSNEVGRENSNGSDDGPTFCDICQISFRFKHSYEAHRQYYCMAKWTDSTNAGGEEGSGKDAGSEVDEAEHSSSSDDQKTSKETGDDDCDDVEDLSSKPLRITATSDDDEEDLSPPHLRSVNEIDENSSVDVTS